MSQTNATPVSEEILRELAQAIGQLRFGSLEITVHEGRVTQIERREKVRLNQSGGQPAQNTHPTAKAAANY
jgi:hypothetical protein